MVFLSIVNILMMRDCLSLTITQMVKPNFNEAMASDENVCRMEKPAFGGFNETTNTQTVSGQQSDSIKQQYESSEDYV